MEKALAETEGPLRVNSENVHFRSLTMIMMRLQVAVKCNEKLNWTIFVKIQF